MNLKIAILILVGLFLAGCAQQGQYGGEDNQQPTDTPTPGETPLSGEVTATINSYSYNPQNITVKEGTKVVWENEQSITHTVTSKEDFFDSGNIEQGDSYSYTFEKPGTYNYYCTIHPSMEGKVVVKK